jgi:hypothetical protein
LLSWYSSIKISSKVSEYSLAIGDGFIPSGVSSYKTFNAICSRSEKSKSLLFFFSSEKASSSKRTVRHKVFNTGYCLFMTSRICSLLQERYFSVRRAIVSFAFCRTLFTCSRISSSYSPFMRFSVLKDISLERCKRSSQHPIPFKAPASCSMMPDICCASDFNVSASCKKVGMLSRVSISPSISISTYSKLSLIWPMRIFPQKVRENSKDSLTRYSSTAFSNVFTVSGQLRVNSYKVSTSAFKRLSSFPYPKVSTSSVNPGKISSVYKSSNSRSSVS